MLPGVGMTSPANIPPAPPAPPAGPTPTQEHRQRWLIAILGVVGAVIVAVIGIVWSGSGSANTATTDPVVTRAAAATQNAVTTQKWADGVNAICLAQEPKIIAQMQTLGGETKGTMQPQQVVQYGTDMAALGTDTVELASKIAAVPAPPSITTDVRNSLDRLSTAGGTMQRVGTFIKTEGATTTSNNADVVAATADVPAALNSLAVTGATSCAPAS